jgi:TonB family protein
MNIGVLYTLGAMAKTIFCLLALLAATAMAADTAASIAQLVNEANADTIAARVGAALAANDSVTRAAAARVALVRGMTSVLPQLRTAIATESDADAAREEVRALVIVGDAADVDLARNATRKLPPAIDDVIATAVSRRPDAFDIYASDLRAHGYVPDAAFFTQALWRRPAAGVAAGSRLLGARDAAGWRALLTSFRASHLAMQAGVLSVSLNMPVEDMRTASVWYLVRSYVPDPTRIDETVRAALAAPKEEASTREAFGRELLRRMLGAERKDDPRWLEWLQNAEADPLLGDDEALFQYFTDKEFQVRKNHCGIASNDCRLPTIRPTKMTIPSTAVAAPPYFLPSVLPPGLAGAVIADTHCNSEWLALAGATSDIAGRVQSVDLKRLQMDNACEKAVTTLMRLSLATPSSIDVPLTSANIILVHGRKRAPCLDEASLATLSESGIHRVGGNISAPIVKHRVEPQFPESARRAMGSGKNVFVIVSCVITREGCVRAVNLLLQSPFPELNGAALQAISQWTFEPGRLHGEAVDVEFNLTVRFLIP